MVGVERVERRCLRRDAKGRGGCRLRGRLGFRIHACADEALSAGCVLSRLPHSQNYSYPVVVADEGLKSES